MKSVGNRTKATLEATRNYVPYIHRSKYFIFENLYSLHFHSIITSDEKQKIASSMQILNTQSSHFT
uniref:Uncharacterized protein n=3 Tax=Equus TaxID=9789 RepID=A0A3Q2H1D3_HORSE